MARPDIPTVLTPNQHERFRQLLPYVGFSGNQAEAARAIGVTAAALSRFLYRHGLGWPVTRARIEEKLALPVDAGGTVGRGDRAARSALSYIPTERGRSAPKDDDPKLPIEELQRRVDATARAKAERERYWLEREAARYGLKRVARPVSGMVA